MGLSLLKMVTAKVYLVFSRRAPFWTVNSPLPKVAPFLPISGVMVHSICMGSADPKLRAWMVKTLFWLAKILVGATMLKLGCSVVDH